VHYGRIVVCNNPPQNDRRIEIMCQIADIDKFYSDNAWTQCEPCACLLPSPLTPVLS
jgi:hypothetical protein